MTLDRALADAPRWMFLGILIYAPLAYGCTRPVAITTLNQFAALLTVCWAAASVRRRRWPVVPWPVVALVTLILLQGWWMAWNAHSVHRYITWTTVRRIADHPPLPGWPGAIDRDLSHLAMLNITALLALFLFACDLMTRPVWRKRVWSTLALTSLVVAVLGTALKLGGPGARQWVWEQEVAEALTTFATYRYHGNAASLMSIGWALVLGWIIVAASQRQRPLRRAGWSLAGLALLLGLFINNSRGGWALAVIAAFLVGGRFWWAWWHTAREHFDWKPGLLQLGLVVGMSGTLVAVALTADWQEKLTRFQKASESMQERYPAKVYYQLAKETGVLGNGADCFQMALPPYMEAFGMTDEKYGFWRHAHNDYYEYLANWGWGGLALWALLFLGGLARGLLDHFHSPVLWGSTQWVLGYCGCAAMIGILIHSRWDFPLEKASILLFFLTLLADGWARHGEVLEASPADEAPAS